MSDPDGQLTDRYEELRCHALTGGHGLGLSLLVRRGLIAWLETWSSCAPASVPVRSDAIAPQRPALSTALQAEVARLLAGMALTCYQEVTS